MSNFKRWINAQIDELAFLAEREPDPQIAEHAAAVVEDASNRAAALGLAELFERGQAMRGTIGTRRARAYLAECLAAVRERVPAKQRLTPPEVARRYGVSSDTVRQWIASGELSATNIASKKAKRPRHIIEPEALVEFDKGRRPRLRVDTQPRRRRKPAASLLVTRY